MNEKQIMVSICCITYNHESYIRQCIDGFLMQQTTFPIEILIHDDASTDGTTSIIREYEAKYPDLIKPIYQTENQYSKGMPIAATYVFPKAKGKYIAMCEGDDYWTYPYKLQKQVEALEANPECMICYHTMKVWNQKSQQWAEQHSSDNVPAITDIYALAHKNFIATLSVVMFRNDREILSKGLTEITICRHLTDFPLFIYLAQYGKVYRINEEMGVYRYNSGIYSAKSEIEKHEQCYTMLHAMLPYYESDNKLQDILQHDLIEHCVPLYLYNLSIDKAKANTYLQESLHIDKDETLVFLNKELGEQIPRFYTIQKNFNAIEQSIAYRIGSFLMTIPHYIKQWCKKE